MSLNNEDPIEGSYGKGITLTKTYLTGKRAPAVATMAPAGGCPQRGESKWGTFTEVSRGQAERFRETLNFLDGYTDAAGGMILPSGEYIPRHARDIEIR